MQITKYLSFSFFSQGRAFARFCFTVDCELIHKCGRPFCIEKNTLTNITKYDTVYTEIRKENDMTRKKKIAEEMQVTALWYYLIKKRDYFDYWLDRWEFASIIHYMTGVPTHRIMRYFFKNVFSDKNFLEAFEY